MSMSTKFSRDNHPWHRIQLWFKPQKFILPKKPSPQHFNPTLLMKQLKAQQSCGS